MATETAIAPQKELAPKWIKKLWKKIRNLLQGNAAEIEHTAPQVQKETTETSTSTIEDELDALEKSLLDSKIGFSQVINAFKILLTKIKGNEEIENNYKLIRAIEKRISDLEQERDEAEAALNINETLEINILAEKINDAFNNIDLDKNIKIKIFNIFKQLINSGNGDISFQIIEKRIVLNPSIIQSIINTFNKITDDAFFDPLGEIKKVDDTKKRIAVKALDLLIKQAA